jgi:hypothetical protein
MVDSGSTVLSSWFDALVGEHLHDFVEEQLTLDIERADR